MANQRTVLCVLVPLMPLELLVLALRRSLRTELEDLSISAAAIDREDAALADLSFAKHTDRSLLGSMNDLSGHVLFMLDDLLATRSPIELGPIQHQLNETPHVKRRQAFPRHAVRELPTA